jgi:predicted outer membrane repeat protein
LEALELRLTPSTLTVTTTADDGSAGSLRGAINAANAMGGAQTVTLGPGLYQLTQFSAVETSTAGDLDITADLTIQGASAATTIIDGGGVDRVFDVEGVLNVSFSNLMIRNGLGASGDNGGGVHAVGGNLSFSNCILMNNSVSSEGGAISTTSGNITLTNCALIGNHASGDGGAIHTDTGAITITDSTLQLNTAGGSGGAIDMDSGTTPQSLAISGGSLNNNRAADNGGAINDSSTGLLSISKTVVINNMAGGSGGAIHAVGNLTIADANVGFNTAGGKGGAVFDGSGGISPPSIAVSQGIVTNSLVGTLTTEITNTNLSADKAASDGGAVYTEASSVSFANDILVSDRAGGAGGAIDYADAFTMTISNSTLNNNVAGGDGGAIYSTADLTIDLCIIEFNAAGGRGGGVFESEASNLTITGAEIEFNAAGGNGGAIETFATNAVFTKGTNPNGSHYDGNSSGSSGGGIDFRGTTLTIIDVEVSNNTAPHNGGGLNVPGEGGQGTGFSAGPFQVSAVTISITGEDFFGNTAGRSGGAMHVNGIVTITDVSMQRNVARETGGAIDYTSGPSLTVTSCGISSNVASTGEGGGIEDDAFLSTLQLLGDFISGNTAAGPGGGVCDDSDGTLTDISTGSTAVGNVISLNTSQDRGGGIFTTATSVNFNSSLISGNRAIDGGGVATIFDTSASSFATSIMFVNDTFAANTASDRGGALFADAVVGGQGNALSVYLLNDTLDVNTANAGSGVFVANSGGAPAAVTLANTLVAGNPLGGIGPNFGTSGTAALVSDGHNLNSDKSGTFLTKAGDLTNITNPMLGPLQDNGGPTFTVALLPGSAAIDAGDDALAPAVDQRGVLRPQDGGSGLGPHVDIGAFEYVQLSKLLATGPGSGATPPVQVFNALSTSTNVNVKPAQTSYSPINVAGFNAGARVAFGDVNDDGVPDVIVGSGPGQAALVQVYDGKTGALILTINPLKDASNVSFTGGVFVAAGEFDGDGQADIVVGADAGGGPRVQVFSGKDGSIIYDFFAFPTNFTGGVRVAVSDINGDGQDDIICGAGGQVPGGGAQVVVLDGRRPTKALAAFSPFGTNFTGGVYVAGGNFGIDIAGDIVAGEGNFGSEVKVYDGDTLVQLQDFNAFAPTFTGGVRVATLQDINGDNGSEVVAAQGPGGNNELKAFEESNPATVIDDFFAYGTGVGGGVFVGGA